MAFIIRIHYDVGGTTSMRKVTEIHTFCGSVVTIQCLKASQEWGPGVRSIVVKAVCVELVDKTTSNLHVTGFFNREMCIFSQ